MENVRVLIAVRHPLLRDAVESVLRLNRCNVVGTAISAHDTLVQAGELLPDIVLIDEQVLTADADGLVEHLLLVCSDARVVILADRHDDDEPETCAGEGIAGLVYKDAAADELVALLRFVVASHGPTPKAQPAERSKNAAGTAPAALAKFVWSASLEQLALRLYASPVGLTAKKWGGLPADFLGMAVPLIALLPLAVKYLNTYPPPGADFAHGVYYLSFLHRNPGAWVSLWNYAWFNGVPFSREYGVLSSYLSLPFGILLGDGPGLQLFLISTRFVFVFFVYLLLKELSGSRIAGLSLSILVAWSANVYHDVVEGGTTAEAGAQVFLPLSFYLLVRFLRSGDRRFLLLASAANGLSFLTHPIGGGLIAVFAGVIMLSVGDARGRRLSLSVSGNLALYILVLVGVGSVIGLPLVATVVDAIQSAVRGSAALTNIRPSAPVDMLLTTNPVLLAVLVVLIGWLIYERRRRPQAIGISREMIAFSVAALILEAVQVAFSRGLNPFALSLFADRTWFLAPIFLAGVAAAIVRELSISHARSGSAAEPSISGARLAAPIGLWAVLLLAAAVGPVAGSSRIEGTFVRPMLKPPEAIDVMMRRGDDGDKLAFPAWLDVDSTNVRAWVHDVFIGGWLGVLYRIPMTWGYYDPYYKPWNDWRNWLETAIRGGLSRDPRYTPIAAKNETKFLLDWFGIRYLVSELNAEGVDEDVPVARYVSAPDIVQVSAVAYSMRIRMVRPEIAGPIVSATNAPTLLVIGDDEAYESIVRALALADIGPQKLIPLRGPRKIDDVDIQKLSGFSAIALYNYGYKDVRQAFDMLEDYVRRGGGVFVDTGSLVRESNDGVLPGLFPISKTQRDPLGSTWALNAPITKAFGAIDVSGFSPPVYGEGAWALSYAPDEQEIRPWAELVLTQKGRPIMVAGALDRGRVVWSGMNLPYHIVSNANLAEALLLSNIVKWIGPPGASAVSEHTVERPVPESISVKGTGFKGVLFKETAFGGWGAKAQTNRGSTDLTIYRAGPDFMYVPVPRSVSDAGGLITVHLHYSGQVGDWALLAISLLTILLSLDYALVGGRVAVKRLSPVAELAGRPVRRLTEPIWQTLTAKEEDEVQ